MKKLKEVDVFLQKKTQKAVDFIYFNFGINNFQIAIALILLAMVFRAYGGCEFYLKDKTEVFASVMMIVIGIIFFFENYYLTKISERHMFNGFKNPFPKFRSVGALKLLTGIIIVLVLFTFVILNKIPNFFSMGFCIDFFFFYFVCCELPKKKKKKDRKRRLVYS